MIFLPNRKAILLTLLISFSNTNIYAQNLSSQGALHQGEIRQLQNSFDETLLDEITRAISLKESRNSIIQYKDEILLAKDIYNTGISKINQEIMGTNYVLVAYRSDNISGFNGGIYKNPEGKIIVSLGGTTASNLDLDHKQDGFRSDARTNLNLVAENTNESHQFTILRSLLNNPILRETDYTITGHSLGGGLAQYGAIYTGMPAITFNTAPLTQNNEALTKIGSEGSIRLSQQNYQITNFRTKNDWLTTSVLAYHLLPSIPSNELVGQIIKPSAPLVKGPKISLGKIHGDIVTLDISGGHSIDNFRKFALPPTYNIVETDLEWSIPMAHDSSLHNRLIEVLPAPRFITLNSIDDYSNERKTDFIEFTNLTPDTDSSYPPESNLTTIGAEGLIAYINNHSMMTSSVDGTKVGEFFSTSAIARLPHEYLGSGSINWVPTEMFLMYSDPGEYEYTEWGTWQAEGVSNTAWNHAEGFKHVVIGIDTPEVNLQGMTGSATYNGNVKGHFASGASVGQLTGSVTMNANFTNKTISGNFDLRRAHDNAVISAPTFSTSFNNEGRYSGDLNNLPGKTMGGVEGKFFGPQAQETGGSFYYQRDAAGTLESATGVFRARQNSLIGNPGEVGEAL